MDTSWIEEFKLENLSLLFGPQAQYLGSKNKRVFNPCITYMDLKLI